MENTLTTLIDCILGSTSTNEDRQAANRIAELLHQQAKVNPQFCQLLASDHGCDNKTAEQLACAATSPSTSEIVEELDELLRRIISSSGQDAEMACLRQAAHVALRLRHLQSRFAESLEHEKLEAIYHLAYGLSHELNNPLANIVSRAGLLLQSTSQPEQTQLLNAVVDNAMRGCEMLGDLMLIARPPKLQLEMVEFKYLQETIFDRGLSWCAVRQVQFELNWQATGGCRLDRGLLIEIIWCVLRNAIEASVAGEKVRVEVSQPFGELVFQIDDDGPGLCDQALRHCFDPYFSGREAGRGLGMGLTKARRLAKLHGGDVTLENRPCRGCRATIRLAVQ